MTATPNWIPEALRQGIDPESGAIVEQLTSEPVTSTNIYCEQRYAAADGSRIAISRQPFGRPLEIWCCDLRTLRLCRLAEGNPLGANAPCNAVYYSTCVDRADALMRLDLNTLTTRTLFVFPEGKMPRVGAVSPDERWFVGGPIPVSENRLALKRVDLRKGTGDTLCEMEDIYNPHLQFDPSLGLEIMVQINRGAVWSPADGRQKRSNALGATLSLVNRKTGAIQPLPVGRPYTPGLSGHECWVGQTGRMVFTAGRYAVSTSSHVTLHDAPSPDDRTPGAALYIMTPGDAHARVLSTGLLFNHIAASDDGRFFVADDHRTGRIYIGSIDTGCYLGLCDSHARQGMAQHSHAHAYLTPDNGHVIFNSMTTGVAQVYAAQVPAGFLDAVLQKRPQA